MVSISRELLSAVSGHIVLLNSAKVHRHPVLFGSSFVVFPNVCMHSPNSIIIEQ